ncbi:MAG: DUF533 domain-containing protein [Pseudomonadota bacterium]
MSLVNTLAKVAIGIAVAKGMKSLTGGGSQRSSGGGLGDLLGGVLGGASSSRTQTGGLEDLLGTVLKGGASTSRSSGGIEDLLGQLTGGARSKGGSMGLEDLMGGLLKGGSNAARNGGLGDLLGQLAGGAVAAGGAAGSLAGGMADAAISTTGKAGSIAGEMAGGLGGLLTEALSNKGRVQSTPTQEQEDQAELLIRAILQAAKADGNIDETEKEVLLGNLGELDQSEIDLINTEMKRPVDPIGLARQVPREMAKQVYMMSVMGINVDTQQEVNYLNDLAQAMGLGPQEQRDVHQMLGVG